MKKRRAGKPIADKRVKDLLEAHAIIAEAKDCLEGIVSECGDEALDRYVNGNAPVAEGDQVGRMSEANEPRSGRKSPRATIFDRIDRALILVKGTAGGLAAESAKPESAGGYWELMIRNAYASGEAPVTVACRTAEKARELMEEDIRETLAAKSPKYEPEDLVRVDENTARLGDEVFYEIEWKDLVG